MSQTQSTNIKQSVFSNFSIIGSGLFAEAIKYSLSKNNAVIGDKAEWCIPCVPGFILEKYLKDLDRNTKILVVSKGMAGGLTACELIEDMGFSYAVLSGPHFAQEIIKGFYTESSIACDDQDFIYLKHFFPKPFQFTDKKVLQFAGIFKNITAYMSGIMTGLEIGKNTIACMTVRMLKEFNVIIEYMFTNSESLDINRMLSPGILGDFILSVLYPISRNFRAGHNKATKQSEDLGTVEAIHSCDALVKRLYVAKDKFPMFWFAIQCVVIDNIDKKQILSALEGL